jgi:MYXO-CTERM domain-containing protein
VRAAAGAIALGILCVAGTAGAGGVLRVDRGVALPPPLAPLGPNDKLKYYGGGVISNVEIIEISWNASVDQTYMTKLQGFYTTIVKSPFIDWMQEYDTIGKTGFVDMMPGTNQHIGRGTFGSMVTITPANMKTSLDDTEIQAELLAQLNANKLPQPTFDKNGVANSLYMIDFPQGISILLEGLQSCNSFGAYHFTITYKGKSVPYGVHPYCGYSFDTSTWIHSHELAEAMTDMEVGIVETDFVKPSQRPLAWVTLANTAWASLESGDLCNGVTADVSGYKVQKIWSNFAQACVAEIPICDGVLVQPACRPCTTYDSGNACSGMKPACATAGTKVGQCVPCTTAYSNACVTPTPVCDEAAYTCVGCLKNSDCKPDNPICDGKSKTCRGCTTDEECWPNACDMQNDAQHGRCVQCRFDADCGPNKKCDMHTCVDAPDAGAPMNGDGGVGAMPMDSGGCGCNTARASDGWFWAALGAIAIAARRRRR